MRTGAGKLQLRQSGTTTNTPARLERDDGGHSEAGENRQAYRDRVYQCYVFEDLELPDAARRLAKAELARVIRKIVADKGWTQRRAAEALGIAPPDMSDLVRGKLARFSQERLERFLYALDMGVHIQI